MDKKIIWGGLTATVVLFLLGYLAYGVLLKDFYASEMIPGVNKEMPDFFPLILGHIAFGFLLALILGRWAKVDAVGEGVKVGFIAGLLMGAGFDLTMYATSNLMSMQAAITDIVLSAIMFSIAAAIASWVMGTSRKTVAA